ncbi:MAG: hypothetical protein ACPHW5_01245 [Candidatus Puniceispirillales bacterium]
MLPPPPGFSAIISGLIYGFRVATGQITAGDTNAHPQDAPAVWDALWASWLISLIIGIPMLGIWGSMVNLLSFMVITLVIVMLYPVISFYALSWLGLQQRFPAFIITMTWINNFRELLVLVIVLFFSNMPAQNLLLVLTPITFWMLWAFWRGASQSLKSSGWTGLLMLALLIVVHLMAYVMMAMSQTPIG